MKHNTILIVDDEEKYVEMLARRLELRGLKCAFCFDGRTGIRMLTEHTYDLIILDLRLPDMYGTEVLIEMKKIRPDIKVLILTGHGSDLDREQCMSEGAHEFMQKPLDIEQLLTIMAHINGENE
ncbi:MAG: response regulator [Candidatus Magnetomorum sp.]|nr:response regulator [Candidatus Magnetomorum sp.]